MKTYKVSDVFVPGGMPSHTYIPREARKLEELLRTAAYKSAKLVTVTGSTKSGKTVLAKHVFPRAKTVWVDGGSIGHEDDFWSYILDILDGYTGVSEGLSSTTSTQVSGELTGQLSLPLVAKGGGKVAGAVNSSTGKVREISRSLTPRAAAISQLRTKGIPLVIDDFHYIERSFQGNIIRAIKPLIFDGLPVLLIAISHRKYDAVKVEREMTGRLETISIPSWGQDELTSIPNIGFPLLNIEVDSGVCARLANEAYGSPHLMQEFCRALVSNQGITETTAMNICINDVPDSLFEAVAIGTGKIVFEKLVRGPRQRTDRMQRKLKNGNTADIYKVVLLALAHLQPGLDSLEYQQLRASIKEILKENVPRAAEVTRVLEKMTKIAASDESSTPVIDWEADQRLVHITDPFFAFYLKWGIKYGSSGAGVS